MSLTNAATSSASLASAGGASLAAAGGLEAEAGLIFGVTSFASSTADGVSALRQET